MPQIHIEEVPISRDEFNDTIRKEHACFTKLIQIQKIEISELRTKLTKLETTVYELKLDHPSKDVNEVF